MLKAAVFVLSVVFLSCSTKKKVGDYNLEFIIKDAISYKYDLKKQVFYVFNSMKPDTTIKFDLTTDEQKRIVDKYYELDLEEIKGEIRIDDKCMIMPKPYTVLNVQAKGLWQNITIDESCSYYIPPDSSQRKRGASFLHFVEDILQPKPEIKKNRHSDIMYL